MKCQNGKPQPILPNKILISHRLWSFFLFLFLTRVCLPYQIFKQTCRYNLQQRHQRQQQRQQQQDISFWVINKVKLKM